MSQPPSRPPARRPVARTPAPTPEVKRTSPRRTGIIVSAIVLGVLGLAIGIGYYAIYVMPLQDTIIKVNDREISIGYFIQRMRTAGTTEDIFSMIEAVTNEELIRQGAPRYGIEVTENEVMDELRDSARGENESISEPEFRTWYRNQLNESGLSEKDFLELVRTSILANRLQEYLSGRVSPVAEQVHLHYMLLPSYEEAEDAATRLEDGANFAELARELSIDTESAEEGGDMGWWPRAAMGLRYDTVFVTPPQWLFDLGIGEVSTPTMLDQEAGLFAIFTVSDRAMAREMEENKLEIVKGRQLEFWLNAETAAQNVTLHGRNNGFDSETHAWIQWQLSRGG